MRPMYSATNVVPIENGPAVPLVRVSVLREPHWLGWARPSALGPVVTGPGRLARYTPDLSRADWIRSVSTSDWSESVWLLGTSLLYGPAGTMLSEIELSTGGVIEEWHVPRGILRATPRDAFAIWESRANRLVCVARNGVERWSRTGLPTQVVSTSDHVVVAEDRGAAVTCVDAETGGETWRFAAADGRSMLDGNIVAGYPSLAVVDDKVLLVSFDRLRVLRLDDGRLEADVRPPIGGAFFVSTSSVFFHNGSVISEFDHRRFIEVDRLECAKELDALYGTQRHTVNGMWVTKASILWSTMHGALMGVARRRAAGGLVTWSHDVGGIMAISVPPRTTDDYLYYTRVSGNTAREADWGDLQCFGSAHAGRPTSSI